MIDNVIARIESGDATHDEVAAMLDQAASGVQRARQVQAEAEDAALQWALDNEGDIRIGTKRWRPGKRKVEKCIDMPTLVGAILDGHGRGALVACVSKNGIKPGAVGALDQALRDSAFDVDYVGELKLQVVDEEYLPKKGGGDG